MARPSVPRHSKSARKPVTIELEPSPVPGTKAAPDSVPRPEPVGFDPEIGMKLATPESAGDSPINQVDTQPEMSDSPAEQQYEQFSAAASKERPVEASRQASNDLIGRLASGVIGGLVALLGAAALQWTGILPSPGVDISALEQQVAELRNAPPVGQTLDEGAQVALNGAVENARQALGQMTGLSDQISSIKQSIADIQKYATAGTGVDTSAIDERIAALETRLSASQQTAEHADGAVSGATERLNALEAKVNDTSGQTNMALAMAATGLKAAIERGEPFGAELDTYAAVAQDPAAVEGLRAAAAKGVPTVSMLATQFDDVAPKIIATTHHADPNSGVLDRLWASAESLVQARPVGMIEGEGVDAITARIEAHLNAGDLDAAIAEWEKLPENAKAVSVDFANAMKARQSAGQLVSKALSDALAGIKAPVAN
ncbi:COG4223 family protein [Phyllobacterium lublinensis]|uniref:COG4223 family protein n=1 Tax=Phyllobacterium lublinensis TaxID=2875708 RepID=UPI001CCC4D9F|nr:mitofilin family membrane protein [Phyllobacterium sp. 2063]MBZ9656553.1 hypothetical protein [Phyllobacterium sp. 2063]